MQWEGLQPPPTLPMRKLKPREVKLWVACKQASIAPYTVIYQHVRTLEFCALYNRQGKRPCPLATLLLLLTPQLLQTLNSVPLSPIPTPLAIISGICKTTKALLQSSLPSLHTGQGGGKGEAGC